MGHDELRLRRLKTGMPLIIRAEILHLLARISRGPRNSHQDFRPPVARLPQGEQVQVIILRHCGRTCLDVLSFLGEREVGDLPLLRVLA